MKTDRRRGKGFLSRGDGRWDGQWSEMEAEKGFRGRSKNAGLAASYLIKISR